MASRTVRVIAGVALLGSLILEQGCHYHHQEGGYHKDFAWYTPEHSSGHRARSRRDRADRDNPHLRCE
jgi:hypothetical protein